MKNLEPWEICKEGGTSSVMANISCVEPPVPNNDNVGTFEWMVIITLIVGWAWMMRAR